MVGHQIQSAFRYTRSYPYFVTPHSVCGLPSRVHGPTGQMEYWLTFHRITTLAQQLTADSVSISAIAAKLRFGKVNGIQYAMRNGIPGAWG